MNYRDAVGLRNWRFLEEVLQVHGIAPASKGEGVTRLIYKNVNAISFSISIKKHIAP
jgi:hypothetical protein